MAWLRTPEKFTNVHLIINEKWFRRSGSILTLINPTPYFITVTNMKAGNSNLPNTMVPPKGEVSVDIPHAVTGDISFQTINDYGALTPLIKATMQ